ncbi:MAG TPA: ABC transporter transmembrane domain-containing protein, partial [Elusimicrobiota bacterium]|nr:ABC transporter transmembrane domain-containing protein [Elusimicrobiota bacterium]
MRRLRLPVALLLLLPPSGAHAAAAVRAGVSGQAAPATVPALGVAPPSSLGSIGELTLPSALDSAALTPAQPVMTVAGAAEASPASLPMGETAVNAVGALEEPPVAASWLPSRPEREELGPRPDVRALKRAGVTVSNRAAPERTASPYYAARFERNANPIREAVAALAHADGSTPDGLYSLGRRAEDAMTGVRAAESGKPEPVPQPGAAPSAPANDLSPAPPVSPAAVPAASPAAPASVKPLPPADAPKKSRLRAILGWPAAFGKRLYRMLMGDPEMKPFLKKYRVQFWTAQGVQLLFSILGVTVAWGMGRLIDLAVDGRDLPNGLKLMIAASGLLLMINVVYATVEWVQNWLEERIDIQFVADIRQHLFKHLTALPLPVLRRHKSQQLSTRLIDDVSELGQKNITLPFHMPFHIYEIVFNAAMLFAVNVKLGWGLLAMLPLFAWLSAHFGRKLETLSEAATDKRAAMAERSGDLLASIEVLRAFGVEPQAHDSFSEAVQDYTKVK